MSDIDYQDLEKFIKKALDSRDDIGPSQAPDAEMLKEIAFKYGLNEDQWDELCEEAEEHIARGRNFASVRDWDETIKELDQALTITPYDEEVQFDLASAYAKRFEAEGNKADLILAKKLLRRCITNDADNVKAVREFEKLKRIGKSVESRKNAKTGAAVLAIGLLVVFGIIKSGPKGTADVYTPPPEAPPEKFVKKPSTTSDLEKENEWSIPVAFPLSDLEEGFSFSTRSSVLRSYNKVQSDGDAYGYELKGILKSESVEIKAMNALLELLDTEETILVRHKFDIVHSFQDGIWPGDSMPVQVLVFKKETMPAIKSARIILKQFERTPINGKMEQGRVIELSASKNPIPPNFSIEVRERLVTRKKGAFSEKGKAQLNLVLSLTNTGNRAIKNLAFQTVIMDKSGEPLPMVKNSIAANFEKSGLLSSPVGSFTAVYTTKPLFLPGERRVVETSILIPDADPDDLGNYDISILEIE